MPPALKELLSACWGGVADRAGRSYITGPYLEDALRVCRQLAESSMTATICYWNTLEESSQQVTAAYLNALGALGRENLDCYLSIKGPALGFDIHGFAELCHAARKAGIRLHFDALAPEAADSTFKLLEQGLPLHSNLGCTLPGRWRRSVEDANWVVERGLPVRVVKGQWVDRVKPEVDQREGFLNVIDRLLGRACHVAVATHDAPLAWEALRRLLKAKTPCELELLLGLPLEPSWQVARDLGVKVRVYLPYGHGYVPYAPSQVRENPKILWWVFRDLWGSRENRWPGVVPLN